MIDEYLNAMEEEASTTGSLAEAAVEKSLAELELAANPVDQGLPQPGLKMGPRPGPMLGQMGEVRWHLASVGQRFIRNVGQNLFLKLSESIHFFTFFNMSLRLCYSGALFFKSQKIKSFVIAALLVQIC